MTWIDDAGRTGPRIYEPDDRPTRAELDREDWEMSNYREFNTTEDLISAWEKLAPQEKAAIQRSWPSIYWGVANFVRSAEGNNP